MSTPPQPPSTDALTGDTDPTHTPTDPHGTGSTGTGTTAGGAMGSGQAAAGAGQSGDDIDESGADLAYPDMTGVGVSSPGTPLAPSIAGAPAEDPEIGAPDGPKGM